MSNIDTLIAHSAVHAQWRPLLAEALDQLDTNYMRDLVYDDSWLPGLDSLFAAFRRDLHNVKYILVGESPYPRKESANGIAFFDAAVDDLWSENGLSKAVNRATSMRNILKTALLAEGHIEIDTNGKISQQSIACIDKTKLIKTMDELFASLHSRGFLMLNATPVLHSDRKPAKEAPYWLPFVDRILELIAVTLENKVNLILWGKIAESIEALPASRHYHKLKCEHPYNISFITNPKMQSLFAELRLLQA